jgi:ectoine utilization protein EutC
MKVTVLTESDIRKCVSLDLEVITAIEQAFASLAMGQATVPPILMLEIPEVRGETDVKTAHIKGLDSFGIKIASGFFNNPQVGLPSVSSMLVVLSAKTGFPEAVLLDNGYLTNVRTGAAGGVAAKYLARSNIRTAGVVGAGAQARYQMMALKQVRNFQKLLIYSIVPEEIDRYIPEMTPVLGVEIVRAKNEEELVRNSDVVVTTTPARKPHLRAEWLHPGLHITAMGADAEGKQELDAKVLGRADRLVCDQKSQCFRLGEMHHGLEEGAITTATEIIELGELTSGQKIGRRSDQEITVCDLVGIGVQDTAISLLTYHRALEKGLGIQLEV